MIWFGLVWFDSIRIELNLNWIWIELNWIECKWIELNWIKVNWIELNWIELNWIELNWKKRVGVELKAVVENWMQQILIKQYGKWEGKKKNWKYKKFEMKITDGTYFLQFKNRYKIYLHSTFLVCVHFCSSYFFFCPAFFHSYFIFD